LEIKLWDHGNPPLDQVTLITVDSVFTVSTSVLRIVQIVATARLRKSGFDREGTGKTMIFPIIALVIFVYVFMGAITAQYLDNSGFVENGKWLAAGGFLWPLSLFVLFCIVLPATWGVEFADRIDKAFR
jgi:hypothetical protein